MKIEINSLTKSISKNNNDYNFQIRKLKDQN